MKQSSFTRNLAVLLVVASVFSAGCGKDAKIEDAITKVDPVPVKATPAPVKPVPVKTAPIEPEVIRLSLSDVFFDYDRAELRADAKRVLDANLAQLKQRTDANVIIEGHCDERGTVEYNLALGQRRAHATMEYLIRRGVDPSRVTVVSYGEERPADPAHTEMAYSRNRRAQFRVIEG